MIEKSVLDILKALEMDLYGYPEHEIGICILLKKLGIKSIGSYKGMAGPLKIESLEAVLRKVYFNENHLKLWNELK